MNPRTLALLAVACIGFAAPIIGRAQDSHDLARQIAEANELRGPFPMAPVVNHPS